MDYARRAPEAQHNHPTPDHLLPLFVPLGAATPGSPGRVLRRGFRHGFLSLATGNRINPRPPLPVSGR